MNTHILYSGIYINKYIIYKFHYSAICKYVFCDFPKTATCGLLISTSSNIGPNIYSSVAM